MGIRPGPGGSSVLTAIQLHISNDGHVLAITLFCWTQKFCDFLGQKGVDLGVIDALALRPTQNPDSWCFTVLVRTSDVSAMQKSSSALKSQMPHMQLAGRLIIKWQPREGGDYEVWDDEAASNQDSGDESASGGNNGGSYGEEGSGKADDEGSSGESDDEEGGGMTSD